MIAARKLIHHERFCPLPGPPTVASVGLRFFVDRDSGAQLSFRQRKAFRRGRRSG